MSESIPAPMSQDQNLLFGILAVQLDFVSQQQLIDAMHAWTLNKDKGLGVRLVEQGLLSPQRYQILTALVKEHLDQHQNSVRESLQSIGPPESLCQHLQSLGDPNVTRIVSDLPTGGGQQAEPDPQASLPHPPASESTFQRFQVLRPLAEGGLGILSVARDTEITRDVALKEIKPQFADHGNSRARFLQEGEITGRLEHPGIVPVYGLGNYSDGRPYYAMRMIRGRSLHEAIVEFHSKDRHARSMFEDDLTFRELLQRFIDICNAIEFAHSRGIVHRDLKPANVMLGKYRETLVVDWGLAKIINQPESATPGEGTIVAWEPSSGSTPTRMGEVVGTIAYMSPEQAGGRHAEVGPASDVYSLGASLYNLLTGKASQQDADVGQLLHHVQHGIFPRPREVNSAIPRALEAICLKAMALRPGDRYPSAATLAGDVERYLADEPVTAHRESPLHRGQRWLRKHPRTVGSIAAAVLVGIVSLAALSATMSAARDRLARANADLQDQTHAAEHARVAAEQSQATAVAVKDFLGTMLQSADPERDGKSVTVFEVIQRNAIDQALQFQGDPRVGAEINRTIGKTLQGLGIYQEAIPLFQKAYDFSVAADGPDHPTTEEFQGELLGIHVLAGMAETVLPQMQAMYERTRAQKGDAHEDTIWWMNNLAVAHQAAGDWEKALALHEQGLELAREAFGPDHPSTLTFINNLATGYQETNQIDRALPFLRQNVELTQRVLGMDHPYTMTAMFNLANGLHVSGELNEALALARETLDLRTGRLTIEHPDTLATLRLLQGIQLHRRDSVDAENTIRTWLTELERHPKRNRQEIASARTALAESLLDQGKDSEAAAELRHVARLLHEDPEKSTDLLRAESMTGTILARREQWSDAERRLTTAFDEMVTRIRDIPPSQRWYVGRVGERIVDLYRAWDRPDEVADWSERVAEIQAQIAAMRNAPQSRGSLGDPIP